LIAAALIYRSHSPGVLLIPGMIGACMIGLCMIGMSIGILLFLQGFRLLRRRCVIGTTSQPISVQSDSHLELVRLSPEPTPLRASEMSQQQKIAAALFKAGMSSPALWATAELPANGGAQALNKLAPGDAERFGDRSEGDTGKAKGFDPDPLVVPMEGTNNKRFLISWRSQQQAARAPGWKCISMIFGGLALALLSLYFLLEIKNLF
jgi:hypothetical protein